jgi:hypothetical protein
MFPQNTNANMAESLTYSNMDSLLEREKQHNKTEPWTKLDKTVKIQKLTAFSEKYGQEQNMTEHDVASLKTFFIDCLDKGKLQKAKDIVYNKTAQEITSIPALFFNTEKKNFTLRIVDPKRVSTLKSLTPKRTQKPVTIREIEENV